MNAVERLERRVFLATATLVKDIIAGEESSVSLFSAAAALNGKLVFAAIDEDHGQELWISNGIGLGTGLLKDINPGGGSSSPRGMISAGGYVFFIASDGASQQVWRTDGTAGGTIAISSLPANAAPAALHYANGKVFYFGGISGLYATTAAGAQTKITSTHGTALAAAGNTFFFSAIDDEHGNELWASDGAGAFLARDINQGEVGSSPGLGIGLNGYVYFDAFDADTGNELWRSNGSGAERVADINPNENASHPGNFALSGTFVYFVADGGANGLNRQIYRTNGTGVERVTSFGGGATFGNLTDVNGTLFFTVAAGGNPNLLYKLAGGTTATLVGTASGGPDGGTNPGFLCAVGSTLFFSALDTAGKARLFSSDGNSIALVGGDAGTDPVGLTNVNGTLYFQGSDAAHGAELRIATGDTPPPPPATWRPRLKVDHATIDEGKSVIFTTIVDGGVTGTKYQYRWDFDGDGVLVKDGYKPTHQYKNNLKDNAARNVRVKVIAPDGSFKNAYINVTVLNVKPTVKATFPAAWVTYAPMPYTIYAEDPGEFDSVNITVDFGDGSQDVFTPFNKGFVSGVHVFTNRQLLGQSITITARDNDGGRNNKSRTVIIDNVLPQTVDDALDALNVVGKFIGGTSGDDRIKIRPLPPDLNQENEPTTENYEVTINDDVEQTVTCEIGDSSPLVIFAGDGNDRVDIDPAVRRPIEASGGSGKDTLYGGSGNDTLIGNSGNDSLNGAAGKDQCYGGTGNDKLRGGTQPDFLVGQSGNDTLNGDGGNDAGFGGPGNDVLADLLGTNLFEQ